MLGLGFGLGFTRGGSGGGPSSVPWYENPALAADGVFPKLIAEFQNERYAVNGAPVSFTDLFTFTRASIGTFIGSNGLLQTASSDVARFTYDPITLERIGLMTEGQRTNILLRSADQTTTWTATEATIGASATPDPTGASGFQKIIPSVVSAQHYTAQTVSAAANTYSFSIFAKSNGYDGLRLIMLNGSGTAFASFNLTNGTLAASGVTGTTYSTVLTKIEPYPSGTYRITLTATCSATTTSVRVQADKDGGATSTYAGDGTSGVDVWGAQLEVGAFSSSYIPTTSAAVTRGADVCSNGAGNIIPFADWYNQSEGTVLVNFSVQGGDDSYPRLYEIHDGTGSDRHTLNLEAAANNRNLSGAVFDGGAFQFSFSAGASALTKSKAALAYKLNDFIAAYDGVLSANDTSGTLPTANKLTVGSRYSSTGDFIFGHIKELRYYPIRVTNSELARITT